jgi:hypothetical protein
MPRAPGFAEVIPILKALQSAALSGLFLVLKKKGILHQNISFLVFFEIY